MKVSHALDYVQNNEYQKQDYHGDDGQGPEDEVVVAYS